MYSIVLVHFGEIGLKGANRGLFERALADNIRARIPERLRREPGRFVLELTPESDLERIRYHLDRTFGIVKYAFGLEARPEIDDIAAQAVALAQREHFETFRVTARRADKSFPLTSQQINGLVGAAVARLGKRVKLTEPQLEINIEVTSHAAYVCSNFRPGPGGLPVGVTGKVLALVSGGIDSPVAAILAMKRGCKCTILHFHNYTFYKDLVRKKIERLAEQLAVYNGPTRLIIVPFEPVQREIVRLCDAKYRMILYRRAMFRIASVLAPKEGALAYVTGDSLAQVASQTLENLDVIYSIADRPVLAPLIGYDKTEIMALARRYGTYDISILPYEDCCSAFIARHPATRTTRQEIEDQEADIDFPPLIERVVSEAETLEVRPPAEVHAPST